MIAWTREATIWYSALVVLAAAAMLLLTHSDRAPILLLGLAEFTAPLFQKIERFRGHGLDVVTAVELTAEQEGMDADDLAVSHFAWKLDEGTEPQDMAPAGWEGQE